ncbi:MAG: peptide-N-glycosidase F-related protein [bacterium]
MKKNVFPFFIVLTFLLFSSCTKAEKNTNESENSTDNGTELSDIDSNNEAVDKEVEDDLNDLYPFDFEEGPYGIEFGDTAGDFTVPLKTGDWNFAKNRSGEENYIFIFYRPSNSESTAIWKTDLIKLFDNSPENTNYFFSVDASKETFEERMGELKENIENALQIAGGTGIDKKIHLIAKPAKELNCWLNDWLATYSDFFLGIDRFQKIRKAGMFHSWESSSLDPQFEFVYKEAELYNYEYELEHFLTSNKENALKLSGLNGVEFPEEGWVKDLFFTTDFSSLPEAGNLFISLEQVCKSQKSCEWDRLEQLFLCEDESSDTCTTEVGRWITTYGRSGKWLTEITPLLPLFKEKKRYKFKFTVTGDQYVNFLDFIFIPDKKGEIASDIIPLFSGTVAFDENYNNHWEKFETVIPASAEKVVIAAYITGHGNGSEQENCAEFCKFESVFTVNDFPFSKHFSNAGTSRGCFDSVKEGAVPNQYGSWIYGRAGWCPGQDVKPVIIDITKEIKKGETNVFSYSAFLNGKDYTPVVTNPEGYRAEIPLTSYLVTY